MRVLAIFGSGLDEIEDEEKDVISRRPLGVQDQEVRDENGRRRFHGAFTGGFSAGYYNTVGTKEGWTPKQFKSSRNERGERFEQNIEDYMDEEDVGEYGIAARRMRTTLDDNFLKKGDNQKLAWERSEQSSLDASLSSKIESLIRPVSESVGIRLLKKMGWREGQGIGPKMSRRTMEKHKQNELRSRGRHEKFNAEAVKEAEEMAPGFEFAPEDVLAHYLHSRSGTRGLGYEGLRKSEVLSEQYGIKEATLKTKRKSKGIRGQAFGVGAFEDEDESIYTSFDLSQYDFAIDGNDAPSSSNFSYDVTFVMAEKRQDARRFFAAPHLPRSFRPQHRPILLDITLLPENVRKFGEKMTHLERAKFLGEVDKNVVLELIRDEDRKRLKAAAPRREPEKEFDDNLFEDEPMKQARFKQYIQYLKRGLHYPQPVEMTSLEWERELADFQRILPPHLRSLLPEVRNRQMPLAKIDIAMPIAQVLSSKFTSASGSGHFGGKRNVQDEDLLSAVRMKMFGEKTRQSHEWHPAKQLAKRFNVPDPYPSSNIDGVPYLQKTTKTETLWNLGGTAQELQYRLEKEGITKPVEGANKGIVDSTASNGTNNKEEKEKSNEQTKKEGDGNEKEGKLPERPPVDLFKAIFADSDDDDIEDVGEDASDKERDTDKNKNESGGLKQYGPSLDSERLNGEVNERTVGSLNESSKVENNLKQKFVTVMDIVDSDDEQFGPAPPPASSVAKPQPALSAVSVIQQNREHERKKKKHHRKEEKKRKKDRKRKKSVEHHSHKKHSKHRKHKRSTTDTDDGSSSVVSTD